MHHIYGSVGKDPDCGVRQSDLDGCVAIPTYVAAMEKCMHGLVVQILGSAKTIWFQSYLSIGKSLFIDSNPFHSQSCLVYFEHASCAMGLSAVTPRRCWRNPNILAIGTCESGGISATWQTFKIGAANCVVLSGSPDIFIDLYFLPACRLASGVGTGNATVKHACEIGSILGSDARLHLRYCDSNLVVISSVWDMCAQVSFFLRFSVFTSK